MDFSVLADLHQAFELVEMLVELMVELLDEKVP